MLTFITSNLLWSECFYPFIGMVALAIIGIFTYRPIFYLALTLLAFSFYFFRNPERVCIPAINDPSVLICPADGTVLDIQYNQENHDGYTQRVSIFLSPIDVHVNWVPISGVVEDIVYKPGDFTLAFLPKASELNERNDLIIKNEAGKTICVRQIAGTIARRIVCWVHKGQPLQSGQKYGMIRFGSRVDILLPHNVLLAVGIGQKVYGGQTVLGRWH